MDPGVSLALESKRMIAIDPEPKSHEDSSSPKKIVLFAAVLLSTCYTSIIFVFALEFPPCYKLL